MKEKERTLSGRKAEPGFEWNALKSLAPYLWSRGGNEAKARILVALVLLTAAKVATVYIPIVYGQIVDAFTVGENAVIAVPVALIIAFGALRVLSIAFAELRDAIFTKVAQRAIRDVALQTFKHLHGLALRYHLERQTGGLSHAIERGTKAIDFLLRFMLFNILPTLLEITLVCGILWGLFSFWYALVTFASIVVYIAYTMIVTEWRLKWRREMNETDQRANTRAIDSLLNYETVKYFGNEGFEASRYDQALKRYERASVISKTSLSLLNIGQALIVGVGLTLIVLMAGRDVSSGVMTIGDFVMVNTYLIQLYIPLNFLGFVYREIKQSLTDMEAMFFLLSTNAEIRDREDAPELAAGEGAIEFDAVSFGYDPRRLVLHDVSFTVAPGQKVAIVGPSGAGKSTVGRLLFRFYDVNAGEIRIDGQDIRTVRQISLRQSIGVVPQDSVLFNDTIYYNIAYGRPDASPAEVEEAARLAAIHEFITSAPDGYQTMVGERGLKLSGGEKQRVAIARTILKAPRILLFDEATSALDTRTEREIQSALQFVSRDRTTLVIAHRLSTVIDADEIIVLNEGRIGERGRHAHLIEMDGIYAAMWREQQQAAKRAEEEAGDVSSALPGGEPA
ncbi:MAG: ABC transporter ATP-binding protein/permease [Pseudomonadota bacterium]|nr:ABC transporter ATP-binding protein/permease [Pseudomonadota bacterium]MEE2996537.1 ABC transporter ATP-binding protein/permease [Pseudomonadota bacterium]